MTVFKKLIRDSSFTLLLAMLTIPSTSYADCTVNSEKIYQLFVDYREQINTATTPEDLGKYFSDDFNHYFQNKVDNARNPGSKGHYMARYWDNLNTARDIVIVFDYSLTCNKHVSKLALIAVLNSSPATEGEIVELWKVKIRYIYEHKQWKIDSFEYNKLNQGQKYLATDIKNNFVLIQ